MALALKQTVLLSMSTPQFTRTVGSLSSAIILSRDQRLLKSIPLFLDSDIEYFEYKILTELIKIPM
jgi:hypothetical protein